MTRISENLKPLAFPVSQLELLPGNPRKGDVEAVARSYKKFGQQKPIVARHEADGRAVVVAGNHQLMAARQLGWQEIAVVWADHLSEDEARAFSLADNRTAELGGYDNEALLDALSQVVADPELLGATGWTEADYSKLTDAVFSSGDTKEDDYTPEPPAVPVSSVGDIWLLGSHRVICGDSTDAEVIRKVLDGSVADVVWTDPPYGVAYVGKTADALTIENDRLDDKALETLLRSSLGNALDACRDGAVWFVAAPAGPLHLIFAEVISDLGVLRQTLVWAKDSFVMGHSDYHYRHEPMFYGWKPGNHIKPPTRTEDTIWQVARPKRSKEHPTMKPVELVARAIRNHSVRGGIVLDVFGGSGTTLVAAQETGRVARLVELDPKYVDVICRRFQELTGVKPVLESTGEPHDFLGGA